MLQDWKFADENKTSHMKTDPIVAFGNMEEAAELRRWGCYGCILLCHVC